jgi:peptide/nickel transport system substrate-binding protein
MTVISKSRRRKATDDLAKRQWEEWALSRRHLIQAGAFALAGSALAYEGGQFKLAPAAAARQEEPQSGGRVVMTMVTDAFSLDPVVPTDNQSIWTMLNIYDQLTRVAPGSQEVEPGLAESWESSEDGLTWTFHLREAKLPDGTPLTASDVVFSLERTFASPSVGFFFASFDSVTADDDRTVTIELSQPWAPMLADLSLFGASIVPQAPVEADPDAFFNAPYSSGPFSVTEWAKGDRILMQKNPNYWEAPKPYLDELEFRIVPDDNARVIQLEAGEVDIATDLPYNQIETLRQTPGIVVLTDPLSRVDYIALNHLREPFGDVNVRKAINYAVNKDQIIQTVLFGNAEPAQSLLPKMLWWNEEAEPYPYDPEMAKQLMAESSVPEGFETDILISAGNSVQQQYVTIVQQNLAEIGITASIEQLDELTLYNDYFQKGEYNMLAQYHTSDIPDPDSIVNYAMNYDGGTTAIWTGYKSPEIAELTVAAQTEFDPPKREEMYHQIQQQSLDDAQVLFLYFPTSRTAIHDWVHDFKVQPTGNYRMWEVWTTRE